MHILILIENLPAPFDRRVWNEATALRSNGFDVSIICPTGKGFEKKYEEIDGIQIYRYALPIEANGAIGYFIEYFIAIASTFFLCFKVLHKTGFDVIQACNPPDLLFLIGGFFKLTMRKKFVFDHHDINPELYEAKFGRRDLFYKLLLFFERLSFKFADVSIATNDSYRKIAIERGGMDPEKVYVVRSGPKLEKWNIVEPKEKIKDKKHSIVGYVGVMGQQEGIDYLLKAAHFIIHDLGRKDISFVLVGGGPSLNQMKKLAIDLKISNQVIFTGRISDEQLIKILNSSDVCVNPDIANDMNDKSTMNKIMEYMALAKPIVQFDLTEGKYSAQEASLYAERNNAIDMGRKIVKLIDDPEACARMGAYGRQRIEKELDWRYEEPKLLAAYNSLISSPIVDEKEDKIC